jgi:ESCRT-I complex subunit VPS37
MSDDRAFEEFLFNLPTIRDLTQTKQDLLQQNANQATQNQTHETSLQSVRTSLRTHQDTFKNLKYSYEDSLRQHQDALVKLAPEYLLSRLRSAVGEAEELSDSIANEFLDGKIGVEDFIKNFRETRKVYHQRSVKLERATQDPRVFTAGA